MRTIRLLALLLLPSLAWAADEPPAAPAGVTVSASQEGNDSRFAFEGGTFPYVLRLWEGPIGKSTYRGLGLRGPWWKGGQYQSNTWYMNNFMDLQVNGKPVLGGPDPQQQYPLLFDRMEVLESGPRALVQYVWERQEATVRLRFLMRPDCRALLAEAVIEPQGPLQSFALTASSFPGGYTSKGDGDRRMKTALREEKSTATLEVDPTQESYFIFCDAKLDLADPINRRVGGEATGCSGLYLLPDGFASGQVTLTGYPIEMTFTAKPEVRRLRFAFDELQTPNAEAFQTVQEAAAQVQEALRTETFAPSLLTGFGSETERATVGRLSRTASVPQKLLPPLQEALDGAMQAVAAWSGGGDQPIALEQSALDALGLHQRHLLTAQRYTRSALRIFEMRGPGYSRYRAAEAAKSITPDSVVDGGYLTVGGQSRNVTPFPGTVGGLYQYDAVLMEDIDCRALAPSQLALLRQYVEDGGGLAVFGGWFSYGAGDLQNSALAEILPLQVGQAPFGLKRTAAVLKPASHTLGPKTAPWVDNLVCPWSHDLAAAPEAQVLIRQGESPWLAARPAGQGRALACAGTLFGEAPAGKLLFWEWPGWAGFEAGMLRWLAQK